jgi:hypothetical protein
MIDSSEEQLREREQFEPARVRDPRTNETYVLVRADVSERMRASLDGFARRAHLSSGERPAGGLSCLGRSQASLPWRWR